MGSPVYHPHYVDAVALMYDSADDEHYYLHDANFNVTAVVDDAGAVEERYAYTPYGEVTILNGANDPDTGSEWSDDPDQVSDIGNEYLYTGRRRDPETGLQLNRNRFYASHLGRWVNRDPIGYYQVLSLYAYVGGMPTRYADPSGLFWQEMGQAIVGGITGLVSGAASGGATGAGIGAGIGAVGGSVIPGAGTITGAGSGAVVGGTAGAIGGGISGAFAGAIAGWQGDGYGNAAGSGAVSGAVGGVVGGATAVGGPLGGAAAGAVAGGVGAGLASDGDPAATAVGAIAGAGLGAAGGLAGGGVVGGLTTVDGAIIGHCIGEAGNALP